MPLTVSVREFRARLSEMIDTVTGSEEHVVVTRNSRPRAILMDIDEYESMQETIEILSDPETVAAIEEGLADIERGDYITIEEVRAELAKRRESNG